MQRVEGGALVVPEGFRIGVFADRLDGVRFLALAPDGSVFASLKRAGRVVRLPDEDGDGRADTAETVLEGLNGPHGLAFRGDTLWVAEEHRVSRYAPPYRMPDVVVPDLPEGGFHTSRSLLLRDDALFVAVGSSCNICDERDVRRAAITRYRLDGSGGELFATGLRNAVGLALHPGTAEIWVTNNDRDRLGDDLPPDRVNIVREGSWYGWPECYLPGVPNPEYADRVDRCDEAIGPAAELPPHSAPLGLAFYTGTAFPDSLHGDLFVALHGSWDRSVPIGYEVVRIPVADGRPAGPWTHFAAGWLAGRRAWGRPVDVLVMPDGALLISDDGGGRVYRVWFSGER